MKKKKNNIPMEIKQKQKIVYIQQVKMKLNLQFMNNIFYLRAQKIIL